MDGCTHKVYGNSFHIVVDPPSRGEDVLYFLITGHLLGNRSLDGVTWKNAPSDMVKMAEKRHSCLAEAMRQVKISHNTVE